MSSSVHIDNKKKILILGEGPTLGLDDTTLTVKAKYSINFTRSMRNLCLSYIIMGATVFHLSMLQKYTNSKILKKKKNPLCLGNISIDFSADNTIKTGLNGSAYDFFVQYIIDTSNIINICKYLMKKNGIAYIKCLDLLKKCLL